MMAATDSSEGAQRVGDALGTHVSEDTGDVQLFICHEEQRLELLCWLFVGLFRDVSISIVPPPAHPTLFSFHFYLQQNFQVGLGMDLSWHDNGNASMYRLNSKHLPRV